MTQDIPADWVLKAAGEKSGWVNFHIEDLRARYRHGVNGAYRALCDMIAENESSPVDRKILIAREACAQIYDDEYPTVARDYRDGNRDNDGDAEFHASIRAIELYEQGFGA